MKPGFVISLLIAALFATPSFAEPTELDKKTVASKAYVDSEIATLAAHTVNGMPLSSPEITFYGTSGTEAATAVKDVYLVDSNGTAIQNADFSGDGRVLIVIPSVTASQASTIKIGGDTNNQGLIYYHGSQADNSVASKIWVAGRPSVFVKNNSGWHFVAGGAEVADTLSWTTVETNATGAYSTSFGTPAANNKVWSDGDQNKLINTTTLANSLALKENKMVVDNNLPDFYDSGDPFYQYLVLSVPGGDVFKEGVGLVSATALGSSTVLSDMGMVDGALRNLNTQFLTENYESLVNERITTVGQVLGAADTMVPTALAVGDALYTKQDKIGATSDGTDNTPNYVYNANTNQYAAGSVVTTTTTAGTTGQVGIATAPTRDNQGALTNGDWIPTMSAIDSMVSGVDLSSHKVNGQPLSNAQITFYGSSETLEATARKSVTLYDYSDPSNPTPITIPELVKGMVIVVKPDHTASTLLSIMITNVSDDRGHVAHYGSSGITTAMAPKVWNETAPSVWVYDGAAWKFVGGGKEAIPTIYWQSQETAATNAYSTTFDGTEGNWPIGDENAFVDGTALAQGLSLKQNKIPAGTYGANNSVVTYDSTAGSVQERWVLGAGVDEVDGAPLSVSAEIYKNVLFNYNKSTGHMTSNSFGTLYDEENDNEIAITQDEAENSLVPARYIAAALSYKQNILPDAWTNTNMSTAMGSQGGQTIELNSTIGSVKRRYITAGGSAPLTLKSGSGVDNVMLYVNGTKSVSEFQTSNFGATGDAATANENYIKGSLVSLELLKDVYSTLHTEIENNVPSGTRGNVAMYDSTTGALGDGQPTADSVVVGANGSVTNGTSIATVTAVSTRQKKLTCGGYESGHSASDPDAMDYCWLWLLAEDEAPAQP